MANVGVLVVAWETRLIPARPPAAVKPLLGSHALLVGVRGRRESAVRTIHVQSARRAFACRAFKRHNRRSRDALGQGRFPPGKL